MSRVSFDRWEQGSHFHHVCEFPGENRTPWNAVARYYYSGRPCINDLLGFLSPERQRTVWMPSHYCDDVVNPIIRAGHPRRYYDGNPLARWNIPVQEIKEGDLLISNCYFGVDALTEEELYPVRARGAIIIDDHSQDPYSALAWKSQAEYSLASLRKSLPLPDGGVLWSPRGLALPTAPLPTPPVFAPRLGGMLAKRLYLQGEFESKEVFRQWFTASETDFTEADLWGMSDYSRRFLQGFDVDGWRAQRARNHHRLAELIVRDDLEVLHRGQSALSPMGLVTLSLDEHARDHLRAHLIAHRIYPVVYWPHIPEVPAENSIQARDFVDRMLFLHMDARYDEADMERVAAVINTAPAT